MRDEYTYRGHQHPHTAAYLWPVVERALASSHRVLDLGCGSGAFTARLTSLGHEAVGVDSSHSGIESARAAFPGCSFKVASAYDDLGSLGLFDAAVSLEVIEHLYSPRKLVRTMIQAVRPGGLVVLSTPFHGYLKNLLIALTGFNDDHFNPLWDHGHIKFFSENTMRQLLFEESVRDVTITRVGRFGPLAMSMIAAGRTPAERQKQPVSMMTVRGL